jgi:hypothetical protein
MENILKALLSESDLKSLNIPLTDLPLYTGPLPRNNKEVEALFSDLPSLKRLCLEKPLCRLYSSFIPPSPLRITIFTWVMGDGLGDFSAQLESAKTLVRDLKIPFDLTLITLHPTWMKLFAANLPCKHIFLSYEENAKGTWENIPPVFIPREVIELLKTSEVLLQIPTYFPQTKALLEAISHPKAPRYELIGEGGWSHSAPFSPPSGFRALGLHFWEKGLFFPKLEKGSTSSLLELIGNDLFCLGYLRNPTAAKQLLLTFLAYQSQSSKDLCLCLFPFEPLIKDLPTLKGLLKEFGIRSVRIFYKGSLSFLSIQQTGKQLTLIHSGKLLRDEYQVLLQRSTSLTGCRGDGSLSETLAAQKIPFLDLPDHKRSLLQGLIFAAEHLLSKGHPTALYLSCFLEDSSDPKKLAALLRKPEIEQGFISLSSFLKERYSIDSFLSNLVLRAGCQYHHPKMAFLETLSLIDCLQGEKTAFDSLQELQQLIQKIHPA